MHSNCRLLPEDIVCKITQRNNIRRANTCDPALKLLIEEITSDIQKHKQNIWKEHLDAHWDHRHNTHTLWKTIHGLFNRAPPHTLNTYITFNNKIATTPKHIANYFTNTVKHATHKTNRHINRATHNIQGYNITLTTSQVQDAIKQSKNNNSQGPDKLNIRHLKHIGPLGLAFLTSMLKTALNKNIIPHTWKLANIVPIPKPNKDTDKGTSYRLISLLSVIAKTLENSILPYITANILNTPMQYGYKTQRSTVTALHTLNNIVAKGFNQMAPPVRTITVALNMSKAFDTINIHTLIRSCYRQTFQAQSLSSSQSTSMDAKPTQHIDITHPNNVNLKLAFHKVASFHPHYLIFIPQTYHHPVHRFRSWPMQTTSQSHPHTHKYECSQEIHTTIPTYSFCLDKTKQPLTKSIQNNLHSVHSRPCRIYKQSGPNNKQQSTTSGNAPKGYLRPKTHIQHTHPQHLSASTQTSTNHKSTHCNRMG